MEELFSNNSMSTSGLASQSTAWCFWTSEGGYKEKQWKRRKYYLQPDVEPS